MSSTLADAVPLGPRPYTLTGGRTEGQVALAVEALATTATGFAPRPVGPPEHLLILQLCTAPTSVAEVSAVLRIPLGVARVLISDLAVQGLLHISAPADGQPTAALLERVLGGLRSL